MLPATLGTDLSKIVLRAVFTVYK